MCYMAARRARHCRDRKSPVAPTRLPLILLPAESSRRYADHLAKAAGQMALIRKTHRKSDFGQRQIRRCQQLTRLGEAAFQYEGMRRRSFGLFERARKVIEGK